MIPVSILCVSLSHSLLPFFLPSALLLSFFCSFLPFLDSVFLLCHDFTSSLISFLFLLIFLYLSFFFNSVLFVFFLSCFSIFLLLSSFICLSFFNFFVHSFYCFCLYLLPFVSISFVFKLILFQFFFFSAFSYTLSL